MFPSLRKLAFPRRSGALGIATLSLLSVVVGVAPADGVVAEPTTRSQEVEGGDQSGAESDGVDPSGADQSGGERVVAVDQDAIDDVIGPPPNELAAADPGSVALQLLIPEPGLLHPSLVEGLRIDTTSTGGSAGALREALVDRLDASDRFLVATGEQALANQRITTLDVQLLDGRAELSEANAERDAAEEHLTDFAVATFVGFETVEVSSLAPAPDEIGQRTLTQVSEDYLTGEAADAVARQVEADLVVDGLEADREQREGDLAQAIVDAAAAEVDRIDATQRIETRAPAFERELLASSYSGTDIPYVVLNAYVTAASITAVEDPSCRVSWHHLAGIGKVESRHGSFGGNTVGSDGRTDGEILGPVLDGDPWLAIPDSDGGVYDGNLEWDRAVGPMQFIPTSWAIFGRDGNGDGEADPHNLYDAALAAAGHLCRRNAGLDSQPSFRQALLGYNRSTVYGSDVIRISDEYLAQIDLPPTYEG